MTADKKIKVTVEIEGQETQVFEGSGNVVMLLEESASHNRSFLHANLGFLMEAREDIATVIRKHVKTRLVSG